MALDVVATSEAASLLGVSPDRVRQLVKAGTLAVAFETGGFRAYARADVLALAEERAEQARSDPRIKIPAASAG